MTHKQRYANKTSLENQKSLLTQPNNQLLKLIFRENKRVSNT